MISTSSENDIRVASEKQAIAHLDVNVNINISHFKPKILEAIDHLKGISHKHPDVDSNLISLPGQLLLILLRKP